MATSSDHVGLFLASDFPLVQKGQCDGLFLKRHSLWVRNKVLRYKYDPRWSWRLTSLLELGRYKRVFSESSSCTYCNMLFPNAAHYMAHVNISTLLIASTSQVHDDNYISPVKIQN